MLKQHVFVQLQLKMKFYFVSKNNFISGGGINYDIGRRANTPVICDRLTQ